MACCDTKYSVSEGGETYKIITKFAKNCTFITEVLLMRSILGAAAINQ